MSKKITLSDFLNDSEIKKVMKLKHADSICEEVIKPNINRINEAIGQLNDPKYLAYLCEYAVMQEKVRPIRK